MANKKDRVLTNSEVAKRVDYALLRCARVLMDVRQTPGLYEAVRENVIDRTLFLPEELLVELEQYWTNPEFAQRVREMRENAP